MLWNIKMKIRCIIFDFDRTLINLTDFVDWEHARQLIIQTNLENGAPENLVRRYSDGSFYFLLNKMHEELLKSLPNKAEKIQTAVFNVLEESEAKGIKNSQLMPGCHETLQWLKNKGVKIGIASSNSDSVIKESLRLHKLNHFIDTIVGRDIHYRMKPHPDQFLSCMKKTGCKPKNSVAVGDSCWDIVAAKEAGMFAIGILTGISKRDELSVYKPEQIVKSLYELPNALITLDHSLASN